VQAQTPWGRVPSTSVFPLKRGSRGYAGAGDDEAMKCEVVWFDDEPARDVLVAGGKGASLAAMTAVGLPVPPGFVIPAGVLEECVDTARLRAFARARDPLGAQELLATTVAPRDDIIAAYRRLGECAVAVRSSACAEDSDSASYAGQQETYLNVRGGDAVSQRVIDCWKSFFNERALFYREQKGCLDDIRMAVVVQEMVEPEKSGVIFTVHPVTRRRDRMLIEAVHGLGEQVVSGEVTPDHYVADRDGIVRRQTLVHGGVLDEGELRELAALACQLETYFRKPQDIEWAIAGGRIHLLQSRPITTL
jgi:pyruvate, water dikinase